MQQGRPRTAEINNFLKESQDQGFMPNLALPPLRESYPHRIRPTEVSAGLRAREGDRQLWMLLALGFWVQV